MQQRSTHRNIEADLQRQRALVVVSCAAPLMFFGAMWTVLVGLSLSPSSGLAIADLIAPALLSVVGCLALWLGRRGRVRGAAYLIGAALAANGSVSLIVLTNAQFTAVVCYCVALSVAAILLPARRLVLFGTALIASALVSALLNSFPVTAQSTLPAALSTLATVFGVVLGLPYPMAMFWLFSRNLERSRAQAWRAVREAEAATREAEDSRRRMSLLADELNNKNTDLSDFLYVVSHDMRAPLINLEGFSRTLDENLRALLHEIDTRSLSGSRQRRTEELIDGIDESLDFILRSVSRADLLVNTVLELSRIETANMKSVQIDLSQTVGEIVASMKFRLRELGGTVEVDPLPVITGDPVRIHQVFANLLDNAVKYARSDVPLAIEVRYTRRSADHLFAVVDNGVGIRADDVGKIFRMFARLGHTRESGDGIGLSIIRKIIERRKGQIWVESTPGVGSTFYFTWPEAPSAVDTGPTEELREDAAA